MGMFPRAFFFVLGAVGIAAFGAPAGEDRAHQPAALEKPVKVLKPALSTALSRGTVMQMDVSGDGRFLATATKYYLNVWNVHTGEHVRHVPSNAPYRRILFCPAGQLLVEDETRVVLHSLSQEKTIPLQLKGSLLEFTPDGKTLLTAEAKTIALWSWPDCARRMTIQLPHRPTSAAISPDGKLAVIGAEGANCLLVDLAETKVRDPLLFRLQPGSRVAGFCPAGQLVIGATAERVEAWHLLTGSRVRHFEASVADGGFGFTQFEALVVSRAGRRAAAITRDGNVRVYETVTGQALVKLRAAEPTMIALSPDGTHVFAGQGEHEVFVWDISARNIRVKQVSLSEEDLTRAFDSLGTQSAADALKTLAVLHRGADRSVPFLARKLRPVEPVDARLVAHLLEDLDGPSFAARATAVRRLQALGPAALAAIRQRATRAMSLEMKVRLQKILDRADGPERIRFSRVLDLLCEINAPATTELLARLCTGVPGAWETEAARRAFADLNAAAASK